MMQILNHEHLITPTYLNTFIRCSKRFYYRYILGLKELDEIEDEIDNRIFGNIFHRASQLFYLQFASPSDIATNEKGEQQIIHPIVIMKGDIANAIKNEALLYRLVDQAFREELFKVKENGYHPAYNGLQLINREVITSYLRQLLKIDEELAPFTIKGLELKVSSYFDFDTPDGKKRLNWADSSTDWMLYRLMATRESTISLSASVSSTIRPVALRPPSQRPQKVFSIARRLRNIPITICKRCSTHSS